MAMKAFQLTDEEIWAANSLEEAITDYEKTTGVNIDPDDVNELSDTLLDKPVPEYDDDENPTGQMTTLRAWLNDMTEPGFLAGYE